MENVPFEIKYDDSIRIEDLLPEANITWNFSNHFDLKIEVGDEEDSQKEIRDG